MSTTIKDCQIPKNGSVGNEWSLGIVVLRHIHGIELRPVSPMGMFAANITVPGTQEFEIH